MPDNIVTELLPIPPVGDMPKFSIAAGRVVGKLGKADNTWRVHPRRALLAVTYDYTRQSEKFFGALRGHASLIEREREREKQSLRKGPSR